MLCPLSTSLTGAVSRTRTLSSRIEAAWNSFEIQFDAGCISAHSVRLPQSKSFCLGLFCGDFCDFRYQTVTSPSGSFLLGMHGGTVTACPRTLMTKTLKNVLSHD